MDSSQDRVWSAFAALIEDERGEDAASALDLSRKTFGEVDETFVLQLIYGVSKLTEYVLASVENEALAIYLVFLTGARLGKQLGMGEGSQLPNLEAIYEG